MKRWLKDHFVPHEGNNHQPHLLRWEATLTVLGIALFFEAVFLVQTLVLFPTHFFGAVLPDVLIDLTNEERVVSAVRPLSENALLTAAATLKAQHMASLGYFSHYAPDGTSPWRWFEEVGYRYAFAGENLAINFTDSRDVVAAWMNSPKHRDNIVNERYTEIGIATAEGVYEGRPAVFVVQLFGRPTAVLAAVTPAPIESVEQPSAPTPAVVTPAVPIDLIEVRGVDEAGTQLPPTPIAEASAESTPMARAASPAASIIAAPRATVNTIYGILGTAILAALLLAVFIRVRIQHPRILVNGILMLIFIVSLLVFNWELVSRGVVVL